MPTMIPQMLTVGEETGRLSNVLEKLTEFYGRELDNSVSSLVSAIEPLIMMVMGGAVGIMVAAIMLPMYQMATSF
jgi:type IV pilus assembly protein PilC